MGSFGGARTFVFNLVLPQTIPQLSARKKSPRLQVMPRNRKGAFKTMLLHLRLTCTTSTVGQLITFSVKLYYYCISGDTDVRLLGFLLTDNK